MLFFLASFKISKTLNAKNIKLRYQNEKKILLKKKRKTKTEIPISNWKRKVWQSLWDLNQSIGRLSNVDCGRPCDDCCGYGAEQAILQECIVTVATHGHVTEELCARNEMANNQRAVSGSQGCQNLPPQRLTQPIRKPPPMSMQSETATQHRHKSRIQYWSMECD